jgi:hypothetical protein
MTSGIRFVPVVATQLVIEVELPGDRLTSLLLGIKMGVAGGLNPSIGWCIDRRLRQAIPLRFVGRSGFRGRSWDRFRRSVGRLRAGCRPQNCHPKGSRKRPNGSAKCSRHCKTSQKTHLLRSKVYRAELPRAIIGTLLEQLHFVSTNHGEHNCRRAS